LPFELASTPTVTGNPAVCPSSWHQHLLPLVILSHALRAGIDVHCYRQSCRMPFELASTSIAVGNPVACPSSWHRRSLLQVILPHALRAGIDIYCRSRTPQSRRLSFSLISTPTVSQRFMVANLPRSHHIMFPFVGCAPCSKRAWWTCRPSCRIRRIFLLV